ncbi:MAG: adenosylcobinamide-GDP ribazoletransferase [Candidatus Binataceae bacterium]|nr:adenosylcobinamide-GDP ribazoletransferase [Candidatus Binataceae bacterium]
MNESGETQTLPQVVNSPRFSLIAEIRLAAAFLTIAPVGPRQVMSEGAVAASLAWFPLIGFIIGLALVAEDWMLAFMLAPIVRSVLLVASLAAITGAVHLDGLADTADALGAGSDRDRALAILRDSRVGSFGAIALFFVLAIKVVAIATAIGPSRYAALMLAPGIGRWAMVAASYRLNYLRPLGAGGTLLGRKGMRNLAIASATAMVALGFFISWPTIGAYVAAVITMMAFRWAYSRWLGGVTGDLIGACGEIVETLVMLIVAS